MISTVSKELIPEEPELISGLLAISRFAIGHRGDDLKDAHEKDDVGDNTV